MSNWTEYQLFPVFGASRLPAAAGVYAIYIGGELVYVGQSVDVQNRFHGHNLRFGYSPCILTPWGEYPINTPITVKVKLSRRRGDWAMWEIRLIHRLRPIFNRQYLGRRRA